MKTHSFLTTALAALAVAAASTTAEAAAVRAGMFNANTLPANDDGFTGLVNIGFTIDFYAVTTGNLFVNNNGNVTFDAPLATFTPFNLLSTSRQIIAPFFADVDTRSANSAQVTYGTGTVGGRDAFGVNWVDVGYYSNQAPPTNSFQLVLIDRSDISPGDFDIEFNYDRILWETGQASGGNVNGLGGSSARAGWSDGVSESYELAGSAINGALLDGGPNALISNRLNSNLDGRYVFNVRSGTVRPPDAVPDGGSLLVVLTLTLGALAGVRRKWQRS